jgi:hypothetical protein
MRQQVLGSLRLQTAIEEIGAELEDVVRLVLQYVAIKGGDLVGVVGREGLEGGGGEGSSAAL